MIYSDSGAETVLDPREVPPEALPLFVVLMDGEPHNPKDLQKDLCLHPAGVVDRVWMLRRLYRARGLDVIVRLIDGRRYYQLVRTLNIREE